MSSLFADTHNVVAILEKSDAAEGFEQIIDFLSGSYIHYALTVNPYIYISCIKQFWNTASVKRSDDITRTSWNEFSTEMASAVICLSKENIVEDVAHDTIPSPPSHAIPSPSQEPSLPPQQLQSSPQAPPQEAGNYQAEGKGKEVGKANMVKSSKLRRRMIDDMDKDKEIELVKDADIAETEGRHATEQEVVEVVTTAKLITDVVTAAGLQVSAANATISAAEPKMKKRLEVVDDEDDDVFIEATPLARKSNINAARLKLKLFKNIAAAEEITK
nr:hypothetical protein [Tanacetum cinerariifolium]